MCHRKALTLEEKVALIKDNQNDHGLSVRQLGDNYKISKSSTANILRRSEEFLADYSLNNKKIDEIVFEWFAQQRAKQIPICGPILQEKARQVAEQLGYTTETFKASNGWLEKFRNRHTISFRTINGESASVDDSTVEEWTQRLSTILDGFNENDVFNAAETGLFYRATPDRSLVLSKEECKCGKKSKERLTVLLCSNLTGTEKLKPVAEVNVLVASKILLRRKVTCHLAIKSNCLNDLQKLVTHIITQCTLAQTADQISITVLDAIKWIDLSWENVTENTIRNGFRAAGFIYPTSTSSSSMMNMDIIIETDIESNNSDNPLQQLELLLAHIDIGGPQLTAAEFVEMDSCIPTFNECDDYGHLKSSIQVTQDDNEEEEDAFVEKPPNLPEALEIMRRLHLFASIEQPQSHNLIYDLESQLTDIYLDSIAVK
ncbi:unnamed protein product [Rotaria magnacalcarata]|uniref:HTH CENPB-type domain-containing protein n=1 Tax=Rotaria magnacalcarata TaxID=392030 RepID=A0A820IRP7_9BILA|nr:unnamed protein product [Rotaria magnacalcarata]